MVRDKMSNESVTTKKAGGVPILIPAIAMQLCVGILYMWSVFQPYVVAHFGWNFSDVALTSSVMLSAFVVGTLLGGILMDKTNPRLVVTIGAILFSAGIFLTSLLSGSTPWMIYVTYGIIGGLGTGFVYSGVVAVVQKWYPHRLGFASGISVSAFGFSVVLISPLAENLLSSRGVPVSFRILAVVFLVITLIASRFIRNPPEGYMAEYIKTDGNAAKKQCTPGEVLKDPMFWCVFFTMFFQVAAWVIILPLIKTIATARGMSKELAIAAVMVTGIANAAGRIIAASVSDKLGRARTMMAMSVITCAASILLNFVAGVPYVIVVFFIAFAYGGPTGVTPALLSDVFGTKYAGTNLGLVLLSLGFSSIVFSKISSALSAGGAATGNYSATFFLVAALCVIPVVLMIVFDQLRKKRTA
jgi:MFS transporter, OFA family, oxalate/formate antiporter